MLNTKIATSETNLYSKSSRRADPSSLTKSKHTPRMSAKNSGPAMSVSVIMVSSTANNKNVRVSSYHRVMCDALPQKRISHT